MAEMAIAILISSSYQLETDGSASADSTSGTTDAVCVGVVTQVGVTVCCASLLPPRPHCPGATLLT